MTASSARRTPWQAIKENLGYARNGVKYFIHNDYQIIWSFLIPFFVLLISYFVFGVWPFGKESVLSLDLNGQYVYYYDHMYDVLGGSASPFYSWSRNLSGEFMGIIGYYLASPFNFLVWMFPREMITEGLLTMMVFKVGSIGLCMGIYLTYSKRCNKLTTIIFSTVYALSGYVILQTMNPMWLDGVMFLPLICLGIERFIDEGRFRLMVIAWVYSFVTCFYIGFMLAIFSALYFLYYLVITPNESVSERLPSTFLKFSGLALLSGAISAFMILPVYKSLSLGKLAFSTPDYSLASNFNLIDLLNKILPNSYDTCRMIGLPFIYCGMITILLVPAYFFMKKIKGRERIASAVFLSVMILCMYIKPVDMLWHGGQLPNWLPQRYSFCIIFLLCIFAAKAFNKFDEIPRNTIVGTALAWFAVILWQESQDHFVDSLGKSGRDVLPDFTVLLPAMMILLVIAAMLVQFKGKLNPSFKKAAPKMCAVLLIIAVSGEAFYNTLAQICKQDQDIVYSDRETYIDYMPRVRETVNGIIESDDGFYRVEKNFWRTVNDPIALNVAGLSHSSSTLNAAPIELLGRLGFTSRSHYTRYSGKTLVTASLFGVKYELSTVDNDVLDVRNGEEIFVDKNEYALPICYLADNGIFDLELPENQPMEAQTLLLNTLLGDFSANYFDEIDSHNVSMTPENVTEGHTTDGHFSYKVITSGNNAQLTYNITTEHAGPLYMYLPTKYERKCNLWVNDVFMDTYFETDNHYLKCLGSFEAGETVEVILTLTKNELYFTEAQFAWLDEEAAKTALTKLLDMNTNTVCEKVSETHLRITTDSDKAQALFTTIPVEGGWKIYVDGVETEYETAAGALIALPLTAGAHTIEMYFTTASYPIAWMISLAGVLIFIGLIILWLKRNPEDRQARRAHRRDIKTGGCYERLMAKRGEEVTEARSEKENADGEDEPEDSEKEFDEGYEYVKFEDLEELPDEEEAGDSEEEADEDGKTNDTDD